MSNDKAELLALLWSFIMVTIDFWVNGNEAVGGFGFLKTFAILVLSLIVYYVAARIAIGVIRLSLDVIRGARGGS